MGGLFPEWSEMASQRRGPRWQEEQVQRPWDRYVLGRRRLEDQEGDHVVKSKKWGDTAACVIGGSPTRAVWGPGSRGQWPESDRTSLRF